MRLVLVGTSYQHAPVELRELLVKQDYRVCGYMNITHMKNALTARSVRYRRTFTPTYGLLFLQLTGPIRCVPTATDRPISRAVMVESPAGDTLSDPA